MSIVDLYNIDCRDAMSLFMPDNSVDAIVCDPPYGLAFMGKKWDYDVPDLDVWTECLRVLKPGGHLLAFAATRTQHRMAVRIEDAGFEIRDMIAWVYGSGFPKSHNGAWGGTALKPALEPITMARKPLIGTVAENWAAHGGGGILIESCRVPTDENLNGGAYAKERKESTSDWAALHKTTGQEFVQPAGRWPANLIHDGSDEVVAAFPDSKGSGPARTLKRGTRTDGDGWGMQDAAGELRDAGTGSAARFFYCAKTSKADRGAENTHPTVKPTELMAYLCRLVTPTGGVVFDPFMGSGSTGKAALREGFGFIGCEMDEAYFDIAQARIDAVKAEQKDSPT